MILDCGVRGFCRTEFMSSTRIDNPMDRVKINQVVYFRIIGGGNANFQKIYLKMLFLKYEHKKILFSLLLT